MDCNTNRPDYIEGWERRKSVTLEILDKLKDPNFHNHDTEILNTIEKIENCASYLQIRRYLDNGETLLERANFCNKRTICYSCGAIHAFRKSFEVLSKFLSTIGENDKLSFITFTMKDEIDLREMIKRGWKALSKISANRKRTLTEFAKFKGGIIAREIVRGRNSRKWHLHFHAVMKHDRAIDYNSIRNTWKKAIKADYEPFVHVEPVDDLVKGLFECIKYPLKYDTEMTAHDIWHSYIETFGLHRYRIYGDLRNAIVEPKEWDNDRAYELLNYKWNGFLYVENTTDPEHLEYMEAMRNKKFLEEYRKLGV